jgi:DNA-binding NarL/FixJ family response regulator
LKRTKPSEIAEAIKQVHNGGSVMTPKIARRVLETFASSNPATAPQPEDHHLTEREKNVLQFMVEGQPRKQIVDALGINTHTLDYVIRCIYRRLHVRSLAGAVSVAVRDGIVGRKGRF